MSRAIIILAEGFEETEAITCIDLLRRADISTTVLGLESLEITGSHEVTIIADSLLKDFSDDFDAIILPGGMPGSNNLAQSQSVLDLAKKANSKGKLCAAVCAAPLVFEKAGLLKGVKATCYPAFEEKLNEADYQKQRVVKDQNIITSQGLGTSIEFALKIIESLSNKETADKIGSSILYC
ncbi:DJ-1/PfpI family protein [Chitinispirillales bacterium ANBcel5]|uniref:DJ-1 family glyoxalase III n=1 Tax=Cellulosispirillum alkaliphilum TaxID=3039283 RepID=UPI002A51DBF8|nr:DJ-1/PfpI family protein [Chitinispirillales bacterium ANBcel5]